MAIKDVERDLVNLRTEFAALGERVNGHQRDLDRRWDLGKALLLLAIGAAISLAAQILVPLTFKK